MAGTLAWFDLFSPGGVVIFSPGGVLTVARAAQESQNREGANVLEIDMDSCANTFGVAPCTATGTKCYNTFSTCKDQVNFIKIVKTYKFGSRGLNVPGELVRPYITSVSVSPTEVKPGDGLAIRSRTQIKLVDETDNDAQMDPYLSTRASPAQGTFWRRFQARNLFSVGRLARLRRGFVVSPFSWLDFDTQLFVIEAIQGPDSTGAVTIVLSDMLKLADRSVYPSATDGKLVIEMHDIVFSGQALSGTTTTIVLPGGASPVDNDYVGMEVRITGGVGNGQREVITAYDGDTRTATVGEFLVAPEAGSFFELSILSIDVGKGTQYGSAGFIRIGDEIIEFTSRVGSVLSWPDSTYRAQFGTSRDDHNVKAGVQLCRAWFDTSAVDVLTELLNAANITNSYIDSAGLDEEGLSWMIGANITACLSAPEKISDLLKELSTDTNLMLWWDPRDQLVKAKVNVPQLESTVIAMTDDDVMSLQVERLDADRITEAAQYYDINPATANVRETKSYLRAEIRIDTDAESANEYNDVRADVQESRWLSEDNEAHTSALVARRVTYLRDAPYLLTFKVDPRTRVGLADLVDITTRNLTDTEGLAAVKRSRITKINDQLDFREIEATTTTFAGFRWGFIAPNAAPNFGSATTADKQYAYISDSAGLMSDGTDAYRII